jgi:beta-glucosidase
MRSTSFPVGSYYDQVVQMVNAGVDMAMEPSNWRDWITTLKAAVSNGDVSMDRIDDAVRRILRVKDRRRACSPSRWRTGPGEQRRRGQRGPPAMWPARRCASRWCCSRTTACSPSPRTCRVFVAGRNADNMGYQCGGWTISWQGGSGTPRPAPRSCDGIRKRRSARRRVGDLQRGRLRICRARRGHRGRRRDALRGRLR